MNKARYVLVLSLCLMLLSPMLASAKAGAKGKKPTAYQVGTTLENLNTVYSGEMHAQAKFMAYAKQADAEGYVKLAKLFRAIAKSEAMHAAGRAQVIESMGGTPTAKAKDIKVGTTKENLDAALAGVNKKVNKMLPDFIKQAKVEKNENAAKALGGALAVKANYLELLKQAAAKPADWKSDGDVYICKVCGNVVTTLDFEFCPVCKVPVSEYEKVM